MVRVSDKGRRKYYCSWNQELRIKKLKVLIIMKKFIPPIGKASRQIAKSWMEKKRNSSVISKGQQLSLVRFLRFFHGSWTTTFLRDFRLFLVIRTSFHDTISQLVELALVWLDTWFGRGREWEPLRSRRFWACCLLFRWRLSRVSSCVIFFWFR